MPNMLGPTALIVFLFWLFLILGIINIVRADDMTSARMGMYYVLLAVVLFYANSFGHTWGWF